MPLNFNAGWNVVPAIHAGAADVVMVAGLDNSEVHIRAIVFEAWHAGGFNEATIANMLTRANADGGLDVRVRQGLHQVEDAGQHGAGMNLHIGTRLGNTNFHLNVHQNAGGRVYVSSISYGVNGATIQQRQNPPPA